MSITKNLLSLGTIIRRKPLLFNSIVYGSFYTGAEFAQQSYNRKYQLDQLPHGRANNEERLIDTTSHNQSHELGRSNDMSKSVSADYDWPTLQRYAIYGCFMSGPILHGCLFPFSGLSLSQRVKSERHPYDWTLLARYALLGTMVYSPIYYYWYKWLDKTFRGTAMRTIVVKLLVDQFILTPPLVVLFFISMSCMEGRKDILHECKMKFVQTFQTSCVYWIPVQFLNFLVVPPTLRVVYVSVAAFCWVNILCYLKRMPLPSESISTEE